MSNYNRECMSTTGKCRVCGQEAVIIRSVCENCSVDGRTRKRLIDAIPALNPFAEWSGLCLSEGGIIDTETGELVGLYEVNDGRCIFYHIPSKKLLNEIKKNILPELLPQALRDGR